MWRCFVRDQARVPSVAGAGSSLFRKTEQFFLVSAKASTPKASDSCSTASVQLEYYE